jgi:putative ABC transport system substrate-binding protein
MFAEGSLKRFRCFVGGSVALVALATVLTQSALGQQGDASIVILTTGEAIPYREVVEGFRTYIGKHRPNASVDTYILSDRNRAQVLDAVRRTSPSVILTIGSAITSLALEEIPSVPVVGGLLLDSAPVRAAPNATGVSLEFPLETSLAWLRRILPEHRAVGVLYDPENNQRVVDAANVVASDLDLQLVNEPVDSPRDLRAALEQIARRSDVIWGIPDSTVLSPQTAQQLLLYSFRQQIPFVGLSAEWVKAGALYALDRDYRDVGAQCGGLAVKILKGMSPQALPPQTPRTVLYDINLKTAQQLDVPLAADVIDGARKVIR